VAPEGDTNEQFVGQQPRCEFEKTLMGEECRRLGEVRFDGKLVCVPHAELLRLEDHSEIMLGMVFEMDQWLESTDGQADELRMRRVEQQRNEVVEQLRFNRTRIGLIRDELLQDGDGRGC